MFRCVSPFGRLAVPLLLASIAGCGDSEKAEEPVGKKGAVIGVSQFTLEDPLQKQIEADIRGTTPSSAPQGFASVELLFKDAGGDSAKQQAQVREFIKQGVEGIILSLDDSQGLTTPVAEAVAAKIPVILLHKGVIGTEYTLENICFTADVDPLNNFGSEFTALTKYEGFLIGGQAKAQFAGNKEGDSLLKDYNLLLGYQTKDYTVSAHTYVPGAVHAGVIPVHLCPVPPF